MSLGSSRLASVIGSFRRWRWQYRILAAVLACLMLPVLIHAWYITLGGNFHTVIPGTVYRSAQPSQSELRRLIAAYGIRTVINLRGDNTDSWYYEEHETGESLNVQVVDVGLWATQPPPFGEFQILVDTLADAPAPILVHCNSGSDRSGLAGALAVLLRSDGTIAEARRQLSVFYGHNPFGKASCHERVLDRYEEWLGKNGIPHSPDRFRTWARTVYSPDDCLVAGS